MKPLSHLPEHSIVTLRWGGERSGRLLNMPSAMVGAARQHINGAIVERSGRILVRNGQIDQNCINPRKLKIRKARAVKCQCVSGRLARSRMYIPFLFNSQPNQ